MTTPLNIPTEMIQADSPFETYQREDKLTFSTKNYLQSIPSDKTKSFCQKLSQELERSGQTQERIGKIAFAYLSLHQSSPFFTCVKENPLQLPKAWEDFFNVDAPYGRNHFKREEVLAHTELSTITLYALTFMTPDIDMTLPYSKKSPLQLAASSLSFESCIQPLLSAQADPNFKRLDGRTALHDATEAGCPRTADLLVNANARPDEQDNQGITPIQIAETSTYKQQRVCLLALKPGKETFV
ncbi:MAG: hypothetical protein S4CHLAM7_13060 [Chlamydiae bacterium]|nr:hypothetical protein [Chlamydiota bacterium]